MRCGVSLGRGATFTGQSEVLRSPRSPQRINSRTLVVSMKIIQTSSVTLLSRQDLSGPHRVARTLCETSQTGGPRIRAVRTGERGAWRVSDIPAEPGKRS